MKATLLLAILLAPTGPVDRSGPTIPTPAAICGNQRPMPGNPQGPPVVCQQEAIISPVPLAHGSCGVGCSTHVLVNDAAKSPKIEVGIDMSCPEGVGVKNLSYKIQGQSPVVLVAGSSGKSQFQDDREIALFSSGEIAAACEKALGGSWANGQHANFEMTVVITLWKSIRVEGTCFFMPRQAVYVLRQKVACVDQSF